MSNESVTSFMETPNKEDDGPEFHIIEDESPSNLNRSWARHIMKIYEVDPLIYLRCGGDMRAVVFIENYRIVKQPPIRYQTS